jgi:hypothetical protein
MIKIRTAATQKKIKLFRRLIRQANNLSENALTFVYTFDYFSLAKFLGVRRARQENV